MSKVVKQRKKKSPKKKPIGILKIILLSCFALFLVCMAAGFIGAGYVYFHYSQDLPDVRLLKDYQPSTITRVYSDQDDLIAEFYIEKRIMAPLSAMPVQLKQATLAVEDSNFYYHFGIDPKAIFRAFITNLQAGHVVEGGSTITQQLTKTLFLSRERTLKRKIREAILAVRMELIFTKDEILEMYLNQIYYGHGTYGVEAASRTYFGKHVQELTLEECAMIASLPKAPNNYSPYKNPKRAKSRRNHAIRRMAHLGFIGRGEAEVAMKAEFELGGITDMLNRAPYFIEHIRQFLMDHYGRKKLYGGGLKVFTTLNMELQEFAEQAVKENLRKADKRYGYRGPLGFIDFTKNDSVISESLRKINRFKEGDQLEDGIISQGLVKEVTDQDVLVLLADGEGIIELEDMAWARKPDTKVDGRWAKIRKPGQALSPGDLIYVKVGDYRESDMRRSLSLEQVPEVQAGLICLEPGTGYIKAMIGGFDFSKSQFNRSVQAIRQPGSAFKPIIYTAAITDGYSPASVIIDSPIIFKEKDDAFDKWKPVNFEEKFYGPTTLRTALTHSRNIVTVKLLQSLGVKKAVQMARDLGISSHLEENLSIALGSSGLTLYELTAAYATFPNMGTRIEPLAIRNIKNRKDKILYTAEPELTQPISSGVAYTITSLLQSVVQQGTGGKVKVLRRPVAGKTGTTNNFVDAWFLGYTPELVTGVWVGNDKDETLGVNETGSRAAIPIWLQFMQNALKDVPPQNFPVPDDVVFVKINPETGKLADYNESGAKFEVFLNDQPPFAEEDMPSPAQNTF